MTSTKKKIPTPKRDPESEFYDGLKRRMVKATLVGDDEVTGILEWVSTYSLGIRPVVTWVEPRPPQEVMLVMKGSLKTIKLAPESVQQLVPSKAQ